MAKRLSKIHSIWKNDILSCKKKDSIVIGAYLKPWYIVSPENKYIEYWSRFMTLLLIYTALVTPYRVAFIEYDDEIWLTIEYLVIFFFFMDFTLNCFLAFYDKDKILICEPKKIILNYLFGWMILDLFSCLPFALIFDLNGQYNSIIRVAKLPRLSRLIKITKLIRIVKIMRNGGKMLKHLNSLFKISASFERLIWFFFIYILLIHLATCMWVFLARIDESCVNWVYFFNFQDYENFDLYLTSLYWAVTTLATVGFGDIVPVNVGEKIYTCFIETIGILFYSYSISSITNILSSLDLRKSKLSQQYLTLDIIANKFKINSNFYHQISQALEYISNNSRSDIDEILNDLPASLSNQVLAMIYEAKIKNNFFFEKKSTEFVGWVANNLKSAKCKGNAFVYNEGDYAHQMYFIVKGKVEFVIFSHDEVIPYLELEKDYYFGELDFLFSEKKLRMNTVKTIEECEFLTLSCDNFYLLLEIFDEEATEICMGAKERLDRNNLKFIDALYSLNNKMPIAKLKSIPRRRDSYEPYDRLSYYRELFHRENPPKSSTLFNKILESKFAVKEIRSKKILFKVETLAKKSEKLISTAREIKTHMENKYPSFKLKYSLNTDIIRK